MKCHPLVTPVVTSDKPVTVTCHPAPIGCGDSDTRPPCCKPGNPTLRTFERNQATRRQPPRIRCELRATQADAEKLRGQPSQLAAAAAKNRAQSITAARGLPVASQRKTGRPDSRPARWLARQNPSTLLPPLEP